MNEKQTHILGCKVDLFNREEVFHLLQKWAGSHQLHQIVTLNPEISLYGQEHESFQKMINRFHLTVPDGVGLKIGAWVLGTSVRERITGRALVDMLCRIAQDEGLSVYLLGGGAGVASRAAESLRVQYPRLRIAGASEGMDKEHFSSRNKEVCQAITSSKADILLVAFGAPKQEEFIQRNRYDLRGVRIAVGIGGLFDYLAGSVRKPPEWVERMGLEWAFRAVTQPWRLKRIWRATVVFLHRCALWSARMTFVYRKNAVAMIINKTHTHVLLVSPWWSETVRWQFPQGGREKGEDSRTALFREMQEEIGTDRFSVLAYQADAHKYLWPAWYRRVKGFRGQKQDLFILEFTGTDADIRLGKDELSAWTWVPIAEVLHELAPARKEIGKIGLDLLKTTVVDKESASA